MAFLHPGLWDGWDHEFVALTKPVLHEGELLVYYSGSDLPCKAYAPDHPMSARIRDGGTGRRSGYAIGVARLRLDGFASMEGYDPAGVLTTRPLRFAGDRLAVNVHAPETPAPRVPRGPAPHGVLRVEVLDADLGRLPGFSAGDCDPVTGDDTRRIVTWRGRHDLKALAGRTVRLRFHLRNAALYSFQFTTEGAADDSVHLGCPGCRGLPGSPAASR
jgi:hypothetical protein